MADGCSHSPRKPLKNCNVYVLNVNIGCDMYYNNYAIITKRGSGQIYTYLCFWFLCKSWEKNEIYSTPLQYNPMQLQKKAC